MPRSTRSSSASASFLPESDSCRISWRPSRWVTAALLLLSVLAPVAVLASEMPRRAAWPLAGIAAIAGLRGTLREARQAPRWLELPAAVVPRNGAPAGAHRGEAPRAALDGVPLAEAALSWRGPLAFLRWRDGAGRCGSLSWWPDTLSPAERRLLRLWAGGLQSV